MDFYKLTIFEKKNDNLFLRLLSYLKQCSPISIESLTIIHNYLRCFN